MSRACGRLSRAATTAPRLRARQGPVHDSVALTVCGLAETVGRTRGQRRQELPRLRTHHPLTS